MRRTPSELNFGTEGDQSEPIYQLCHASYGLWVSDRKIGPKTPETVKQKF